ncbi:hypothetical protein LAZ67_X002892 [Cordylochernes scorpioides]|uniref:Transposase n=1 Tax=Cordylochernes scorpioides TaxID=51811 RepID=A0ABY6LTP7_9ARAC|nr:hypothetical protein LAZ67_X002892 [Cordylochernes scorpioides]
MDSCKKKKKKASKPSQPSVDIAALPSLAALHLDLVRFIEQRTEIIKCLVRDVKNLAGTVNDFMELDEIMNAQMSKKTCQTTQTGPAPTCKDFIAQTEPIKPATPAPAAVLVAAPAPKKQDPPLTKRKQPEASNPKRTKSLVPAKPASSRALKPSVAKGTLNGEKSAAHIVVIADNPQADPRDILKTVRAAHTLPQGVWASLRTREKLVLHSNTPKVISAVSSALDNKLQGLKVRELRQFFPRICLFNVEAETADEDIVKAFLSTDALSQLPGDKSVRVVHRSPNRNGTCTAFIELDLASYKAIGRRGGIIVDQVILNYEETISRRLVANGLHSCRPLRRLPLTPPNRRQRLEWCRARSTWMTEWHRVVFSDESRFCLSSDSRRVRVWRRRGERSNPAAFVERPTVRQRGIMVWGAIAYDSRSPLLRIQGTMTAQRYVDDVLRPVTLPYLQGVPNALYQQDNARPHTARISQQALQDVQMLPWPPYSPDLSPIEHVWDIIGRRLHALPQPRSEDELWQMEEVQQFQNTAVNIKEMAKMDLREWEFNLPRSWELKIGWDSQLPEDMDREFRTWCSQIGLLSQIKIPRHIWFDQTNKNEIHVFCDAICNHWIVASSKVSRLNIARFNSRKWWNAHLPTELRLDYAVRYCKMAWDSVSPNSISNCWNQTGIIRFTSTAAVETLNYGNLLDRIRDIFAITPENLMTEREFQLVDDSQEAEMKLADNNFLVSTVTAKE